MEMSTVSSLVPRVYKVVLEDPAVTMVTWPVDQIGEMWHCGPHGGHRSP